MKIISIMDNRIDRFIQKLGKRSFIVILAVLFLSAGLCFKLAYDNSQSDKARQSAKALLSGPQALANENKHEEAYQEFNRLATDDALKDYPDLQAEAAFRTSYSLQMLNRYSEALDGYNNFVAQFPDSQWVENALAASVLCYSHLQNYEASRKSFEELLNRFPNSQFKDALQDFITSSLMLEAEALLSGAKALADESNHEEAYQEFNRLAVSDELKDYPDFRAEAMFRAASSLQMLGKYDEALGSYDNFVAQFPDSQWVENTLYLKGILNFYGLSNYNACRDVLKELQNSYPESTFKDNAQHLIKKSFLKEAEALLVKEKYQEAYQEFNRIATDEEFNGYPELQTEAKSKATYSFLKQVGRDDEELIPYIDFLTESFESQFVEDNALFNIGLLTFKLRNYKESLRAFEQLRENLSDSDLKASSLSPLK